MASKLKFYRGDTVNINLTFTDVDLTGATVYFTIKDGIDDDDDDSTALITKDVTSHTDATAGTTKVTLDPADSLNVALGTYDYDVQLKTSDGDISTVEVGKIQIQGDVTRRTT